MIGVLMSYPIYDDKRLRCQAGISNDGIARQLRHKKGQGFTPSLCNPLINRGLVGLVTGAVGRIPPTNSLAPCLTPIAHVLRAFPS